MCVRRCRSRRKFLTRAVCTSQLEEDRRRGGKKNPAKSVKHEVPVRPVVMVEKVVPVKTKGPVKKAKKEETQLPNIDQLAYAVPVKSGRVSGVREVFLPPTGGEEAEGHRCSCDAEALFPGVDVSATKGMNEHVAE